MRVSKEEKCAKKAREYIGNRLGLIEGKIYTLRFRQQLEGNKRYAVIKKRMRFLKAFPHHALFENSYGIKRSFTWWEVEKILKGEQR
jgi:hypothetical protein